MMHVRVGSCPHRCPQRLAIPSRALLRFIMRNDRHGERRLRASVYGARPSPMIPHSIFLKRPDDLSRAGASHSHARMHVLRILPKLMPPRRLVLLNAALQYRLPLHHSMSVH